ncbi:hypothetical protein CPLU01_03144 [Colletotrichum plurivorum]|uniref:Uncharacterized protein n=1 Tax=Colletotrichum plurivorum TaxID=2175906 RepID=A0A8H6KTI7_9PEZI|nr:hypothetical protein CPLU01_03144 [Colletotrichum plurivorum]
MLSFTAVVLSTLRAGLPSATLAPRIPPRRIALRSPCDDESWGFPPAVCLPGARRQDATRRRARISGRVESGAIPAEEHDITSNLDFTSVPGNTAAVKIAPAAIRSRSGRCSANNGKRTDATIVAWRWRNLVVTPPPWTRLFGGGVDAPYAHEEKKLLCAVPFPCP